MKNAVFLFHDKVYLPIKDMSDWYSQSTQTIRKNVREMKETGRYNVSFLVLDEEGKQLINTLMYEDFLAHKTELRNSAMAKRLPKYDPKVVRKQRGEYDEQFGV